MCDAVQRQAEHGRAWQSPVVSLVFVETLEPLEPPCRPPGIGQSSQSPRLEITKKERSERKSSLYQCFCFWQGTHHFIEEMGFKRMTPVQAIAIPLVLKQRDVAVEVKVASAWQNRV